VAAVSGDQFADPRDDAVRSTLPLGTPATRHANSDGDVCRPPTAADAASKFVRAAVGLDHGDRDLAQPIVGPGNDHASLTRSSSSSAASTSSAVMLNPPQMMMFFSRP